MLLLIVVFITILFVVFGIFAVLLRPEKTQTEMDRRLTTFAIVRADPVKLDVLKLSLVQTENATTFRWVENLIGQKQWAKKLGLLILQSHSSTTIDKVLITMLVAALGVGSLAFWLTTLWFVSLGAVLLAAYLPIAWLRIKRQRRLDAFNAALPDCIETCARSLRAGHSIVSSIDIVSEQSVEPAKEEFREVFKKQNYGLPLRDALEQMLERMPSSDLRVLVTGILVQKDTGGNLAEIMDRIALVIRDRIRIAGEVRTHTAQGRLTGWILVLLPLVLMLVINLLNPGYSSILFTDALGRRMLYVGLTLLIVGGLLIRKIVKGIEV